MFDYHPSILPVATPEKPKTLSTKKKQSVMNVNETPPCKSPRLRKKSKKSRVRSIGEKIVFQEIGIPNFQFIFFLT